MRRWPDPKYPIPNNLECLIVAKEFGLCFTGPNVTHIYELPRFPLITLGRSAWYAFIVGYRLR